ncbi:hypothetical protein N7510_008930 [Penicillium lagena]|uniref:uncharacterized protein n=1 Tax=Penicillium lagena TaxID=94218 RepID=UPI00253F94E1|nr:uncharacterized protein N7510_008930 [Penicillium lagena]KAJ5606149.1 hypothetical protein N7510_008930 [Penicillium lagena]
MASEDGPKLVIETARGAFSPNFQVDIIVNNAGFGANFSLEECTADNFAHMYNLNTRGPLFLVKAALPYLPHDRSGRVINISSVASSLGAPGHSIYGGTKAALESMTRTWSRELAERATVNSINPGPVATDLWDAASPELKANISTLNMMTPLAAVRKGIDRADVVEEAQSQGGRSAYANEIAALVALLCSPDSAWSTGSVLCANGGMRFSY